MAAVLWQKVIVNAISGIQSSTGASEASPPASPPGTPARTPPALPSGRKPQTPCPSELEAYDADLEPSVAPENIPAAPSRPSPTPPRKTLEKISSAVSSAQQAGTENVNSGTVAGAVVEAVGPVSVGEWLAALQLEQFLSFFTQLGVEDVNDLELVQQEDLEVFGMSEAQITRFRNKLDGIEDTSHPSVEARVDAMPAGAVSPGVVADAASSPVVSASAASGDDPASERVPVTLTPDGKQLPGVAKIGHDVGVTIPTGPGPTDMQTTVNIVYACTEAVMCRLALFIPLVDSKFASHINSIRAWQAEKVTTHTRKPSGVDQNREQLFDDLRSMLDDSTWAYKYGNNHSRYKLPTYPCMYSRQDHHAHKLTHTYQHSHLGASSSQ